MTQLPSGQAAAGALNRKKGEGRPPLWTERLSDGKTRLKTLILLDDNCEYCINFKNKIHFQLEVSFVTNAAVSQLCADTVCTTDSTSPGPRVHHLASLERKETVST